MDAFPHPKDLDTNLEKQSDLPKGSENLDKPLKKPPDKSSDLYSKLVNFLNNDSNFEKSLRKPPDKQPEESSVTTHGMASGTPSNKEIGPSIDVSIPPNEMPNKKGMCEITGKSAHPDLIASNPYNTYKSTYPYLCQPTLNQMQLNNEDDTLASLRTVMQQKITLAHNNTDEDPTAIYHVPSPPNANHTNSPISSHCSSPYHSNNDLHSSDDDVNDDVNDDFEDDIDNEEYHDLPPSPAGSTNYDSDHY